METLNEMDSEFLELNDNEKQMVQEYWDEIDPYETIENIKNSCLYKGSLYDYAELVFKESYNVPDEILKYIDFWKYAQDLAGELSETKNYIFSYN